MQIVPALAFFANPPNIGVGGSNDNIFFRNDFSHAVANGIEATFSRNRFIENRIEECWHGVWGGYSYQSSWIRNRYANNTDAIAIEHGQHNTISENVFDHDDTAIRLWQNPTQDPDWGYAKSRDTRSHGYRIGYNRFRDNPTALNLRDTSDVVVTVKGWTGEAPPSITREGDTSGYALQVDNVGLGPGDVVAPDPAAPLPGGMDAMIKPGERRGRDTIIVDEWGPYDWKSPKLWPVLDQPGLKGPLYGKTLKLRVLGPTGDWKVARVRGASVDVRGGKTGDQITVTPKAGSLIDYDVALQYRGTAVVSPRGAKTPAGQPYLFHYSRFFVPIDWHVRLFEYTDASDPVKQPAAFAGLLAGAAKQEVTRDRLDYMSSRSIEEGVARDRFALVADGTADLPPGDYVLSLISDDAARVWVDGEEVIDAWTPHESKVDRAQIRGGRKKFKVEYYEIGGFAELRFDIQRR